MKVTYIIFSFFVFYLDSTMLFVCVCVCVCVCCVCVCVCVCVVRVCVCVCVCVCVGFGGLQGHFTSLHTNIIRTFGIMGTEDMSS